MNDVCPYCQQALVSDGIQANVTRGTMLQLASCTNPDCDLFRGTFTVTERKMTIAELKQYADVRERLGVA